MTPEPRDIVLLVLILSGLTAWIGINSHDDLRIEPVDPITNVTSPFLRSDA